MKLAGVPFYQAHSNNYTKGRGRAIRNITVHHSAGLEDTLRYLWQNPTRNGSSHFWVGNKAGQIEQYVDTDDTAWTNGNWPSNQESITIEVRGDWRNGYYDQTTLNNLQTLITKLRQAYPNLGLTYHMDVSSTTTLCPADLKHKGYAKRVWDNVTEALKPKPTPTPTPPASKITYRKITPKRVVLNKNASLWNFNFTEWAKAKAVEAYPKGHSVDVVAIAKNALGGEYYMTAYSYNNGAIRATNGFNIKDADDYVPPVATPKPTPTPVWVAMDTPRKMVTTRDLKVLDLDTLKEVGDTIAKGTEISLVEKKTLANNKVYVRSKWARDNNKNWGIPLDSVAEIPTTPTVPQVETIPPTPIDTNPNVPSDSDVVIAKGIIEQIKTLLDKLLEVLKIK